MTTIGTIEMQGIRALGRHGVLPEEKRRAQPFEVDVRLTLDVATAAQTDDLEDTVDYGLLAEAVARTVELHSYALLEKLADHVARVCLGVGPIDTVEVTVRKLRPPLALHVSSVAVTITKDRAALDDGPPLDDVSDGPADGAAGV